MENKDLSKKKHIYLIWQFEKLMENTFPSAVRVCYSLREAREKKNELEHESNGDYHLAYFIQRIEVE